jgi:hypothetical protein
MVQRATGIYQPRSILSNSITSTNHIGSKGNLLNADGDALKHYLEGGEDPNDSTSADPPEDEEDILLAGLESGSDDE